MNFLKKISILAKLVYMQMFTAILVVFTISIAYLYLYYKEIKTQKIENIKTIAKVLSTNLKSALIFDDNQTAFEIISDLKTKNDLIAIELIDKNGQIFTKYAKDSRNINLKKNINYIKYEFHKDFVYLQYPIFNESEYIGTLLFKMDTKEISYYLENRVKLIVWIILFILFIAFIIALVLQRQISSPIYKILNTINLVKIDNNYNKKIKIDNKDEIGELSIAINEMFTQIHEKDLKLYNHNKNLQKTVKERTAKLEENNIKLIKVNEDLIKAKIQAEQSKAVKDLFLANMSHEIRTPLNAIIGFQQLLKNTTLNKTQKEYVEAIDFAGKNLLSLINDILDLSKIESGKLEFESIPFNVKEIVDSVVDLFKQKALEKKIQLKYSHDRKIPNILYGDSTRFSQILINLVGNALKFTEIGSIELKSFLSYENNDEIKCTFEVKDTGIGIEKKNLPKIFDRFSQASSDTSRMYGGTGLGLTICKFLVEGFGGRINVYSEKGKGSTFVFDLVFKKNDSIDIDKIQVNSIKTIELDREISILLAEDVEINQKLMKKIANNWGYKIDIVDNGEEALKMINSKNYDVLLLDIQMPIMNGFVTCINIRQLNDEKKKNIPIIALTAQASNAEAEKCINLGMNAYISKPFDQIKLKETIIRLLSKNELVINKKNIILPKSDLFDFHLLKENANGDIDYIKDMFISFLDNIPVYLNDLNFGVESKNNELIYENIHKIKSPILLFGLKQAETLIKTSEVLYKNKEWSNIWYENSIELMKIIKLALVELRKINSDIDK